MWRVKGLFQSWAGDMSEMLAGPWGNMQPPGQASPPSQAQTGAWRAWFISRAWVGGEGSGLGQLGKTVASKVHSKNDLALILKSEANSLKTRKERVEIMPTVWYAGLAKMSQ